jgi:hypothetical protein
LKTQNNWGHVPPKKTFRVCETLISHRFGIFYVIDESYTRLCPRPHPAQFFFSFGRITKLVLKKSGGGVWIPLVPMPLGGVTIQINVNYNGKN